MGAAFGRRSGGALLAAAPGAGECVDELLAVHLGAAFDVLLGGPLVQLRLAIAMRAASWTSVRGGRAS
jgi:hypothetical protein